MSAAPCPISPSLATTVCPNCGYSLLGLPDTGTCPECGRNYDQSEVILYGWARGQHENVANTKTSRIAWVFFLSAGWMIFQLLLAPPSQQVYWAICILFPAVFLLWRRQNTTHPGMIQIRLNEQGCVQFDDLTGNNILREIFFAHGYVIPLVAIILLPILAKLKLIGIIGFWIWFVLAMVIELFAWRPCYRIRKALRQVREGSIADINAAYKQPTSWNFINRYSFKKLQADAYRLQINSFHRFWEPANSIVDAEIHCDATQAEQIQQALDRFISLNQKTPAASQSTP